jgi:hypothetical protein
MGQQMTKFVDFVFESNEHNSELTFIEVENDAGKSIALGEWVQRPDGYVVLRVPLPIEIASPLPALIYKGSAAPKLLPEQFKEDDPKWTI